MILLPDNLLIEVLDNSANTTLNYKGFGNLDSYEFWPHWNSKGSYVEPDIFLRFENADIIIEAKKDDSTDQTCKQWKKK